MPSLRTSLVFAAATLLTYRAHAQETYTIDPSSVPIITRQGWCSSQTTNCPAICLQLPGVTTSTTKANTCDPVSSAPASSPHGTDQSQTTLDYSCICSNGASPNASEFSLTLPYFICTEYGSQCIAACAPSNSTCQEACRADNPCGAQSPRLANASAVATASTTASATATKTVGIVNGLSTSTSTSEPSKNGAQMTLDFGRSYGLAILFSGIFAGFALVM